MTSKKRTIRGEQFPTAAEAIRHAKSRGSKAILVDGRNLVVDEAECLRLQSAGVEFAYLGLVRGRVVTIPVN